MNNQRELIWNKLKHKLREENGIVVGKTFGLLHSMHLLDVPFKFWNFQFYMNPIYVGCKHRPLVTKFSILKEKLWYKREDSVDIEKVQNKIFALQLRWLNLLPFLRQKAIDSSDKVGKLKI